jgi:hypothetical protein
MASNINPNNIDTAYPIAGQDNDSQGFRDNFTNIKTNFEFAEQEIDDLQSKVLLKSALTGTTLDNDMAGAALVAPTMRGVRYTRIAPTATSGNVTIDFSAGSYYRVNQNGNINLAFTNIPSAGNYAEWTVQLIVANAGDTVTFPKTGTGNVNIGNTNIQGADANNVVTFNQSGTYSFKFSTSDGGATVAVEDLERPRNQYMNPLFLQVPESFAANGNVSLTTSTTVFTSSANRVGNLNAGTTGQIKILAYGNAAAGNTRITVANAAWGGSNIANLSAVGSACTMQWVSSKWFVIGNNGVTFS